MRGPKPGAHYKDASLRHTHRVSFRVTDREMAVIRGKAAHLGVSVSEYIVSAAVNKRVPGYKYDPSNEQMPGQLSLDDVLSGRDTTAHQEDGKA